MCALQPAAHRDGEGAGLGLRRGLWDTEKEDFSEQHSAQHIGQESFQSITHLHTSLPYSLSLSLSEWLLLSLPGAVLLAGAFWNIPEHS